MAKIELTPVSYNVLEAVLRAGKVNVPDLTSILSMDRGKIEGTVAQLVERKLIKRELIEQIHINLTSRGKDSLAGLVERRLIDALLERDIHMRDIAEKAGLSKQDSTAAIGILRKADLISIDRGIVHLTDREMAAKYSVDLQDALYAIGKNNTVTDNSIIKQLRARGMIEVEEKTTAVLSPLIKDMRNIVIIEEVTRLTPSLLHSGEWQNVNFKPYALDTKPRQVVAGRYHPYRQFLEHLKQKLIGLGFEEMKGPIIEQEYWNFDSLFAAQDHPAREDSDILLVKNPSHGKLMKKKYVKNVAKTHENGWKTGSMGYGYKWNPEKAARLLLRPQGTSISARTLPKLSPPAKYFSIARCFRPDQIDATHAVEFDQTEGIICDESITFQDLLGMLKTFATEVAGATEVRFRPDFYPFTSPSVELSAKHPVLGYIEFGGAGIFRPEVTQPFGIDYPVLAWGLGVGRLFMTKYQINDIRELFSQNLDYLRNEMVSSGISVEN